MAEFVESAAHELVSIMHNFSDAQHGKGPADFEAGKVKCTTKDLDIGYPTGHRCNWF